MKEQKPILLIAVVTILAISMLVIWSSTKFDSIDQSSEPVQEILVSPLRSETFRAGQPIDLRILNNTKYTIRFPIDFNVTMFQKPESLEIVIVPDGIEQRYGDDIILQPLGHNPDYWVFTVLPILELSEPKSIIIGVRGNILEDGRITEKEVLGQTEILIMP